MADESTNYTKTSVGIDTQKMGRAPRRLFAATLILVFLVTAGFGLVARRYRLSSEELQIKGLPIPTEFVFWVSAALENPAIVGGALFAVIFLCFLGLKGLFDKILKWLIGLNILWLIVFLLASLITWITVFKIGEQMRKT